MHQPEFNVTILASLGEYFHRNGMAKTAAAFEAETRCIGRHHSDRNLISGSGREPELVRRYKQNRQEKLIMNELIDGMKQLNQRLDDREDALRNWENRIFQLAEEFKKAVEFNVWTVGKIQKYAVQLNFSDEDQTLPNETGDQRESVIYRNELGTIPDESVNRRDLSPTDDITDQMMHKDATTNTSPTQREWRDEYYSCSSPESSPERVQECQEPLRTPPSKSPMKQRRVPSEHFYLKEGGVEDFNQGAYKNVMIVKSESPELITQSNFKSSSGITKVFGRLSRCRSKKYSVTSAKESRELPNEDNDDDLGYAIAEYEVGDVPHDEETSLSRSSYELMVRESMKKLEQFGKMYSSKDSAESEPRSRNEGKKTTPIFISKRNVETLPIIPRYVHETSNKYNYPTVNISNEDNEDNEVYKEDRDVKKPEKNVDDKKQEKDADVKKQEKDADAKKQDEGRDAEKHDEDRDAEKHDEDRDAKKQVKDTSIKRKDRDATIKKEDRDVKIDDSDVKEDKEDKDTKLRKKSSKSVYEYAIQTAKRADIMKMADRVMAGQRSLQLTTSTMPTKMGVLREQLRAKKSSATASKPFGPSASKPDTRKESNSTTHAEDSSLSKLSKKLAKTFERRESLTKDKVHLGYELKKQSGAAMSEQNPGCSSSTSKSTPDKTSSSFVAAKGSKTPSKKTPKKMATGQKTQPSENVKFNVLKK